MTRIELIPYEISGLQRYSEALNQDSDDRMVVERIGQCLELFFKAICVRDFGIAHNSPQINEPLAFLNSKDFFGKKIFFKERIYLKREKKHEIVTREKWQDAFPSSKIITRTFESLTVLYNSAKHTTYPLSVKHAKNAIASIQVILRWYFCEHYDYRNLSLSIEQSKLIETFLEDDNEKIRELYFKYIEAECGKIQFDGLSNINSGSAIRETLEKSYVPLGLLKREINKEDDFDDIVQRETIDNLLSQIGRVLILGEAGVGKSTLLKSISLACIDPDRGKNIFGNWEHSRLFPIYVRCRDLNEKSTWTITEIIDGLAAWALIHSTESFKLKKIVIEEIRKEQAVLIFDGIDEINEDNRRRQFINQLARFLEITPSIKAIVSSREFGMRKPDGSFYLTEHLAPYRIPPLNKDEIVLFNTRWYSILSEITNTDYSEKSIKMANQICGSSARHLAKNPLILTQLLLVERANGELLTDKNSLFQETINLLINEWNVEAHGQIALDYEETEIQLASIAYWMTKYEVQTIKETDLREALKEARKHIPRILDYSISEFVRRVEARTGLLRAIGNSQFEFIHLSFQEFLAARAIVNGYVPDDDDFLAKIANPVGEGLIVWNVHIDLVSQLSDEERESHIANIISFSNEITAEERERFKYVTRFFNDSPAEGLTGEDIDDFVRLAEKHSPLLVLGRYISDGVKMSPDLLRLSIDTFIKNYAVEFSFNRAIIQAIISLNAKSLFKERLTAFFGGEYDDSFIRSLIEAAINFGFKKEEDYQDMEAFFLEVESDIKDADKVSKCIGLSKLYPDCELIDIRLACVDEGVSEVAISEWKRNHERIFETILKEISFEDSHFVCFVSAFLYNRVEWFQAVLPEDYAKILTKIWFTEIQTGGNPGMRYIVGSALSKILKPGLDLGVEIKIDTLEQIMLSENDHSYSKIDKVIAVYLGVILGVKWENINPIQDYFKGLHNSSSKRLFAKELGITLENPSSE